jgi:hypothetical protein
MDDRNDIIDLLRHFATRHDPDRLGDVLNSLAPHDESVVAALAEALTDEDDEVRLLAVEILRELGPKAEPVLPTMIRALEDENRIVRIASLEPVAAFGEKAMDAVPILEKWRSNSPEFDKVSAAGHILMIDPSKTVEMMPFLDEALASENTMIQRQAQWLLDELGVPYEDRSRRLAVEGHSGALTRPSRSPNVEHLVPKLDTSIVAEPLDDQILTGLDVGQVDVVWYVKLHGDIASLGENQHRHLEETISTSESSPIVEHLACDCSPSERLGPVEQLECRFFIERHFVVQ